MDSDFLRNDDAATVINPKDLQAANIAVDEKGRIIVVIDEAE